MKISKKLLPLFVILTMIISSCGIFNGSNHCDCPKFGQQQDPDDTDFGDVVLGQP